MATGDLKNNLKKLHLELKKIRLPQHLVDIEGFASGKAESYLPIYDYLFDWFSPSVMHLINEQGLKLPSYQLDKNKFLETLYLILREVFSWKPTLTISQFLSTGFAEHKCIMCTEIAKRIKEKHVELETKTPERKIQGDHCGIKISLQNFQTAGSKNSLSSKKEAGNCSLFDVTDASSSSEDNIIQQCNQESDSQAIQMIIQVYHKLHDICEEMRDMKKQITGMENQLHDLQQKVNCLTLKVDQVRSPVSSNVGCNSPGFRGT